MQANHVFQNIIHDIINDGAVSQPRDMKVNELTIDQRVFDPTKTIADFTSRKFNWKYFAGELAWYMSKDRDVDYIGQFSGMWSTLTNPDSNEINSNYGSLLFGDQLKWVVESLKSDKNTRQAIAFLNQPKFQFKGNKDFVCTMYLNFFIRDNKLNMKVQMRSNDVVYGYKNDYAWQQHVLEELAYDLHIEAGKMIWQVQNLHVYEKHFDLIQPIHNR